MLKKCEVIQNGFKNCGASSLLSIIKYYGGDVSVDELTFIMKTDNNGTNAYNIIEASKCFGFDGYGMKVSFDEVCLLNNYPVIAHVIQDGMYHFVVIYKITNKVLVMDPLIGFKKINKEDFEKMFLGTILVIYPCKKIIKCDNKLFKSLLYDTFKGIKSKTLCLVTFTIFVIILSLFNYIILKYIIDNFYFNSIIFAVLIVILIIKFICDYFRMNKLLIINNYLCKNINNKFFRHLFSLPYLFFKNKTTGEVVNRANDIEKFRNIISIFVNLSTDILFIIFSSLFLCYINYKLFILIIIFMVIYVICSIIFYKICKEKISDEQMMSDMYNKNITESIYGYEINRNLNLLNLICKKNEISYVKYIRSENCYDKLIIKDYLIKDFIIGFCQIVVLMYGLYNIKNNYMSYGDYIIFSSLMLYFIDPIKNVMNILPNIKYFKEIINRINNLIMFKGEDIKEINNLICGDIRIEHLSYSYNNKDLILKDVSLSISYDKHIMLYASSGYGKSTLLKIILKYLTGYDGNIYIGEKNIKDIDINLIASSFTYISQNNYLNNDTLKNNIIYYRNINDKEYENVLRLCHISKIIDKNALRDNLMIEENGFNLSGGERQKVISARSLLKKSNYLIFDEAFSEVGLEEEKIIINNIRNYYRDKCIIYVSHKEEIKSLFDEVIYL